MAKKGIVRLYRENVIITDYTPQEVIKRYVKKYPILELYVTGNKKSSTKAKKETSS